MSVSEIADALYVHDATISPCPSSNFAAAHSLIIRLPPQLVVASVHQARLQTKKTVCSSHFLAAPSSRSFLSFSTSESLDGTTTEEEESTSIEHVDDELEDSEPTGSFDVCTFLDRHGVTRSTKLSLSPASDEIVVLMTSGRWRPNGFPSVFFVPRTFLSRASPSFKSLLDKMDADLADSKKRSYQRIEGVDDRLRFSSGSQEHMFIGVEDHPNDLQDFLEALHKYEYVSFSWRASLPPL